MISCGIDVESLDRASRLYRRGLMPFGLFSKKELKFIDSYLSAAHAFVAKEAILKSLGAGWFNTDIDAHDIELGFDDDGLPKDVAFFRAAKQKFDDSGVKNYSLEFFYFDNNLLALFVLSGPQNRTIKKSVVVVDRIQWKMKDLCSSNMVEFQSPDETHLLSTKLLGRFAVTEAVFVIRSEFLTSATVGQVGYDHFGAPIWIDAPTMGFPAFQIDAVSITHNRNYACGAAISADLCGD